MDEPITQVDQIAIFRDSGFLALQLDKNWKSTNLKLTLIHIPDRPMEPFGPLIRPNLEAAHKLYMDPSPPITKILCQSFKNLLIL